MVPMRCVHTINSPVHRRVSDNMADHDLPFEWPTFLDVPPPPLLHWLHLANDAVGVIADRRQIPVIFIRTAVIASDLEAGLIAQVAGAPHMLP